MATHDTEKLDNHLPTPVNMLSVNAKLVPASGHSLLELAEYGTLLLMN
jgi:hypothetical protein